VQPFPMLPPHVFELTLFCHDILNLRYSLMLCKAQPMVIDMLVVPPAFGIVHCAHPNADQHWCSKGV